MFQNNLKFVCKIFRTFDPPFIKQIGYDIVIIILRDGCPLYFVSHFLVWTRISSFDNKLC